MKKLLSRNTSYMVIFYDDVCNLYSSILHNFLMTDLKKGNVRIE